MDLMVGFNFSSIVAAFNIGLVTHYPPSSYLSVCIWPGVD